MLYHPDFIVYLWLVPIFFLVFLPLTLSLGSDLLKLTRRFLRSRELLAKEKRRDPRFIPGKGAFAEITAGDTTCTGLVCNISRLGISLKHLPDIFFDKMDKLTIVIRGDGVDQNLLVKPKWVLATDSGKRLGAEIDTAPPSWRQFLMQSKRLSQSELA
ncbi:MAG: hypothetical protein KKD01_01145 [Proteobacteria bacterium]|nr:hypothetical protein [Pseudomonadota bacterium]MBU1234085.1 hypothetical protein [Pseudomonadota bacterium]MBU1418099.1 hypothetical protein [Pseudomonadota bacterium]MBU1453305.1 hypothetical protein [Pseudomonadota bacterium]